MHVEYLLPYTDVLVFCSPVLYKLRLTIVACFVHQGTPVLQVMAVDGDTGSAREIVYELVSSKLVCRYHNFSYLFNQTYLTDS